MIYDQYLQEQIKKYCEIAGIPMVGGMVSAANVKEVNRFINYSLRAGRIKTQEIEETNRFRLTGSEFKFVQQMTESPIEQYVLMAFMAEGLDKHCRPQFEIGKKRVDFAFPVAKLAVECDGREYHIRDGELMEKDLKRDAYLSKKGWRVLHFDGLRIRRDIRACMNEVKTAIAPFIKLELVNG